MGRRNIEKPKVIKVTAALIKEFVDMEPAPHDRPLSERRLMVYERILNAGEFRPCTWASAHCIETGETYRVNGKHTSKLLAEKSPIPEFFVVLERHECDTLEDVARLYATFDSSLGNRTAADINASFAATVPALRELTRKTIGLCVPALSYVKWGKGFGAHPAPERAELLLDSEDFCIWIEAVLFPRDGDQKRSEHLRRSAVVTTMLQTYLKAKADADKFWALVRDEDSSKRDDPSRTLARFLNRSGINKGMGSRLTKSVTNNEMMVKCIHAWNAWRSGANTDLKYYPNAKTPTVR